MGYSFSQSSPIFNQKLTDYFTYDPSRTGFSGGSLVFTHQQLSGNLENSPSTSFLGAHTRFFYDQVGVGGSIYYQESGIVKTYRIAINGAYHMKLNDQLKLSFGLAPEMTRGELDFEKLFVLDSNDPVIENYGNETNFDLSSGVSVNHRLFDAGLVMNRMISLTQGVNSGRAFPGVYSAYLQGKIGIRSNKDLIEPMVFVNQHQDGTTQIDVGGFYTYENLVYAGAMYRTNSIISLSIGYAVKSRLIFGYAYQLPIGSSEVNNAHEITLRWNFNKQYYDLQKPSRDQKTISPEKKSN